ncbi:hypothetical protein [Pontibacter mangrovi]|uniref:Uncharacterized protein n=1 Tax=Pontibacter mangrovi TaxID=2589816 RepID=A0A501W899_9BACT|nr:hypothetical protein [Pontibacter mangrovi]TPE44952.1 hypothetical protein FJM65_08020 [Pontibacter mangrovi]
MKVHLEHKSHETFIPEHEKERRRKAGEKMAACGYTRKNTTTKKEEVTCFYCLQVMSLPNFN